MSRFRIYRVDSSDPRKVSRQNQKLYMAYAFLSILVMVSINIRLNLERKGSPGFFYTALGIFVAATIWVLVEMKRQSKDLQKIGSLEFTRSSVTKKIGDLTSACPYGEIKLIEIERHLRNLSVASSKTGSLTHIIKIVHKDLTEENFIISDRSIDFGQKITIHDTLKTLKNSAGLNCLVKNT